MTPDNITIASLVALLLQLLLLQLQMDLILPLSLPLSILSCSALKGPLGTLKARLAPQPITHLDINVITNHIKTL